MSGAELRKGRVGSSPHAARVGCPVGSGFAYTYALCLCLNLYLYLFLYPHLYLYLYLSLYPHHYLYLSLYRTLPFVYSGRATVQVDANGTAMRQRGVRGLCTVRQHSLHLRM